MEQTPTATSTAKSAQERWKDFRTSKSRQRLIRNTLSYIVLAMGTVFMLFPMLWMISASLKPSWQIFSEPIIWIPQKWEEVRAGNTNRYFPLWNVTIDGESQNVIRISNRRYTTVIDSAKLNNLQSAPVNQLGDAIPTAFDDVFLNIRQWKADGDTKDVIALARDGDNMIVAEVSNLHDALLRLPLDVVNAGERADAEIEGVEFRGRALDTDAGGIEVIPIGPESELLIVGSPEIAVQARLVPADQISNGGTYDVGETSLKLWNIGDDSDSGYVLLSQDTWHPVINEEILDEHAFVAPRDQIGERQPQLVQNVVMQVAPVTPKDGDPFDAIILVSGTNESLVIALDKARTLRLAELGGLITARGDTYGRIPYRVQEGFEEGDELSSVALVGDPRDMALLVPQSAIDEAFDVAPEALSQAMHMEFSFDSYIEALQTKVAETYFPTFFRNSFVLVGLNIVGHLLSCIVVAYAFARLRAPGKNFLFIVLLGTMMLPFPVTLVPVYELFTKINAVNTLWPLFVRAYFGNAFLIFMLRQFFAAIPRELEDAAHIDGANVWQIIWNIIIPLSKPAIATVIIFTFWWTWNSFLEPFIYLSSPELFPVSVGLNFFQDQYATIYYDRLIAASVMSMVPMLLIFFFAQRYFIEGIQLTGMKG